MKVSGSIQIVQCPIHGKDFTSRCPDCRADDVYLLADVIPHGLSMKNKEFIKHLDAHLGFYRIDAIKFHKQNKYE